MKSSSKAAKLHPQQEPAAAAAAVCDSSFEWFEPMTADAVAYAVGCISRSNRYVWTEEQRWAHFEDVILPYEREVRLYDDPARYPEQPARVWLRPEFHLGAGRKLKIIDGMRQLGFVKVGKDQFERNVALAAEQLEQKREVRRATEWRKKVQAATTNSNKRKLVDAEVAAAAAAAHTLVLGQVVGNKYLKREGDGPDYSASAFTAAAAAASAAALGSSSSGGGYNYCCAVVDGPSTNSYYSTPPLPPPHFPFQAVTTLTYAVPPTAAYLPPYYAAAAAAAGATPQQTTKPPLQFQVQRHPPQCSPELSTSTSSSSLVFSEVPCQQQQQQP